MNNNFSTLNENMMRNEEIIKSDWDYIKSLAKRGLDLYPLVKGTKLPLKGSHGIKDATSDINKLKALFKPNSNGDINYNIACVPQSMNWLVLDIDSNKHGISGTSWLQKNAKELPKSIISEYTQNGGYHFFFNAGELDAKSLPNNLRLDGQVEVKTNSTIIYPSKNYAQTGKKSLIKDTPVYINKWLTNKINEAIKKAKHPQNSNNSKAVSHKGDKLTNKFDYISELFKDGIPKGERNNKLSKIAENLYTLHASDAAVKVFMKNINNASCKPPLPQKEITSILKSKRNKKHLLLQVSEKLTNSKATEAGLATNKNGTPKTNFSENFSKICLHDFPEKYKYNEFSEDIFVKHGNTRKRWQDADLYKFRQYVENNYNITPNNGKTAYQGIFNYAKEHSYHPVKAMIEHEKWDGVSRISNLFIDYLGADDNEYNRIVARKFFVGAVARIYEPGVKFELMPILTGKQGIGKSTLIRKISGNYFLDNLSELSTDNKDDTLKLQDSWIAEVQELKALKTSKIEEVKAFVSARILKFRRPYGSAVADYSVHNVYIGTTNEVEFLPDKTGNRRFLPVECGIKKPPKHVFDLKDENDPAIYQMYAEALYLYKHQEPLFLNADEEKLANSKRTSNETYDPVQEAIEEFINMPIPTEWAKYSECKRQEYYIRYQDRGVTGTMENNQLVIFNNDDLTKMQSVATKELLNIPLNKRNNASIVGTNRALSRKISNIFVGFDDWKQDYNVKLHGKRLRGYKRI